MSIPRRHRRLGAIALLALLAPLAPATAAPLDQQRRQFEAAWQAARTEPGLRWRTLAEGLERYPLYPWLEQAALMRDLRRAEARAVEAYLARHADTVPGERLRSAWLARLAAESRWRELLAAWTPQRDLALRCQHARARLETGAAEGLASEVEALWLTGRSLPAACDAALAWLARAGHLDETLYWRRIEIAAEAREHGLIRHLAASLPAAARAEALRWAAAIADPGSALAGAAAWPLTERDRALATLALTQLARRDAALAGRHWLALEPRFGFEPSQRARVLNAIALQKAARYDADARDWIARVPRDALDAEVAAWAVREALGRADFAAAREALAMMPAPARDEARWRYLAARLAELGGDAAAARAAFASLAREASFHGFLAAERIGEPYSICPLEPPTDPVRVTRVERDPALVRAFEWLALERRAEALAEWAFALARFGDDERRIAVKLAQQRGWLDRGPSTLLKPEDQRYYALRFPLGWADEIRTHARRHGLDPAYVFGLIRAESAWIADARSSAGARGLMQIMPANGPHLAKREKLPWRGADDLLRPATNIALGTRYLADALARAGGRKWVATAAYNAGPAPVNRWLAARGTLPADLFLETIPFRETREYVPRVLAFSVIYDWRLEGTAGSLLARLGMAPADGARRPVACAVAAAAPAAASP